MDATLEAVKNRCRCGAVAEGIVEQRGRKKRIVACNCVACGLAFVADDMREVLTPEFQSLIKSFSIWPNKNADN